MDKELALAQIKVWAEKTGFSDLMNLPSEVTITTKSKAIVVFELKIPKNRVLLIHFFVSKDGYEFKVDSSEFTDLWKLAVIENSLDLLEKGPKSEGNYDNNESL